MRYNSILETIGRTPLVRLNNILDENSAEVYVKPESFNDEFGEGQDRSRDDR